MFAGVTFVIFRAFHSGYGTSRPHAEAQVLAEFCGGISALAWGLSMVGTLVWEDFGIVSSIKWNSWFNFFAARSDRGWLQRKVNFGELMVSTKWRTRAAFFRRPRESGGPGQALKFAAPGFPLSRE
jgi:hypothetical protein